MTHASTLRKNQQPDGKNKSFIFLKKMIYDPLISAKRKFFEKVSQKLNAFLRGFQTDSPMVPFFTDVLGGIVRDLLKRIILKAVLRKATNLYQLFQIDPSDKNIRKSAADIDIRFAANIKVEESNLNPNDPKALAFKKEAGNLFAALLSHLLEKSPLKYALVRSDVSLNLLNMANKAKRSFCFNHFSILLQRLVKANKISSQSAERSKAQYSSFFDVVDSNVTAFKDFNKENDRLDRFFADFTGRDKSYADMWEVCKIMFTLSHGQSSVKRGFTVNKQFSIENLKEKSFIALRRVTDHMLASEETPVEVQITKYMLHYVKDASRKYKEDLCQQRQEKENERKSLKRKIVDDEIKQIKAKYGFLEGEIEGLTIRADKLALKAEKHKNFTYVTESNEKNKICKTKKTEMEELKVME